MRIMLMFDLPSVTLKEKKVYRDFLRFLKGNGFFRLQESVYVKLAIDQQVVESTIKIVQTNAPKNGSVIIFNMTEKQFANMKIIVGDFETDVINDDRRTVVL